LSARDQMVGLPTVRTYLARYLAELGDLPGAAEHATAGMKVAESAGSPFALATGYFGVASVELRRGDYTAAMPTLERALEICRSQHVHNWAPAIGASLGYALANAGRPSEGLTLAERATRRADRMQIGASYSLWLTYLADAHLRLGQLGEAQRAAEAALERARKHGEQGHEAWALFLLASVAARAGASGADAVEKIFEHAIELAGALGMRPLLAYCHAGLADACDVLGRPERAAEARARAQRIREEIGMISPEATASTTT
jgi:tetratricopeptide (TPR) repeat protein